LITLLLRNISRRKFRAAIMIISIGLAASLLVSLEMTTTVALYSALRAYTEYVGDFDIIVTKGNFVLFNTSEVLSKIQSFSEIYAIGPRLLFGAAILRNVSTIYAVIAGINISEEEKIGGFEVIEGDLNLGKNTCILLENIAKVAGVSPGDNISIMFYDTLGYLRSLTLKVVGIVRQYGKLPADMNSVIFLDLSFSQEIFGAEDEINFLAIKIRPELIDPRDVDRSIRNIVGLAERIQVCLGFEFTVSPLKAQILSAVSEGLMFQRMLYDSFASITTIMAVLLVLMISLMNIHDRLREIGILRAIGASRIRIFTLYFLEVLMIGTFGGITGLFLGISVHYLLRDMILPSVLHKYAENLLVIRIETLATGILIGLLISMIGGLYPAIKASFIPPREALQPAARRIKLLEIVEKKIAPEAIDSRLILLGLGVAGSISMIAVMLTTMMISNNLRTLILMLFSAVLIVIASIILIFVGFFPKIVKFMSIVFSSIFKTLSRIAGRNILRYKHRSIILFFMLSLAVASLFTISFLANTQIEATEHSIKLGIGADIVIYGREPLPENITSQLEQIIGIEAYCPITYPISVRIGDVVYWRTAYVKIYGINPENYTHTTYMEDFNLDPDGIATINENMSAMISKGLAEFLDVGIGDRIRFEYGRKTYLLNITHISPKAPGFAFTTYESRAQGTDILVSLRTFRNITGNIWFSRILIKVRSRSYIEQVVEDIMSTLSDSYDIQVASIEEYLERSEEALKFLEKIVSTLLSFAIFVAILGEMLSVMTAVKERTWEIGVLRAIGARRSHVALIFMLEAVMVSIIGFLAGFVAAYIVTYEATYIMNAIGELGISIVIHGETTMRIFLIVVIPTAILAYLASYVLSGKNIAETIAKAERV